MKDIIRWRDSSGKYQKKAPHYFPFAGAKRVWYREVVCCQETCVGVVAGQFHFIQSRSTRPFVARVPFDFCFLLAQPFSASLIWSSGPSLTFCRHRTTFMVISLIIRKIFDDLSCRKWLHQKDDKMW